ncbi:MAG TPA: CpaD family pilus assembly protein [Rhizomicrobium sp.]|jgi:pilus assembly protein CpaD|nr:CpaD family pilus assembly protein [Rhizomicrobium sp.]
MKMDHLLRALAVGSVLVASSCSVANDGTTLSEDGARNHPIAVEPSYRDLKVQFTGSADGVSADDAGKFDAFVADYRVHGNGMLSISVPSGAGSRAAITFFAERAAASGISRDKILVSTREAGNSDPRVDVSYITYTARAETCGDWSENLAFSADNVTPKNFGCSIQHNIAAMVANPRDLLGPGPMGPVSTNRRALVVDHYEKGEITQADKRTVDKAVEQSAGASAVGQ